MKRNFRRGVGFLLVVILVLSLASLSSLAAPDFERGYPSGDGTVPLEVYSPSGLIEMLDVPESSFPVPSDIDLLSPPPLDFEVVQLVNNGPDSENIVITIMGDGFTASQQDYFITSATTVSNYLLNFVPFSNFKDKFNVYAVKVISNVSGAARSPSALLDNYFGSTYYFDNVTERLLYVTHSAKVREILNTYTPKCDMPVIIVNDTLYGGGGGTYAVTSLDNSAREILVHELGHSFGGLIDEYWWRGTEGPNMTRDNSPLTSRWRHWVGYESVSWYPHSESPTWFRPHQNCEMRYLNRQFCMVCATELTRRASLLTSEPFFGQSTITDRIIPYGSTRILDYSYYGSEVLKSLTIPASVETIGRYAFLRCSNLTYITNNAIKPQTINTTTFAGVDRANISLYVPKGTTAAYLAAGWTGFKEIVEIGAESNIIIGGNVLDAGIPVPASINVPLKFTCEGGVTTMPSAGFQFKINYDPALLKFDGPVIDSSIFLLMNENPVDPPGTITVACAAMFGVDIAKLGEIVLPFKVIGSPALNDFTALKLTGASIMREDALDGNYLYVEAKDVIVSFSSTLLGDINGDGLVTPEDAMLLLQMYVGLIPWTSRALLYGDINGDGVVDPTDAALILRLVVGG